MSVSRINTSTGYMQRTMQQQMSQVANELTSGKRKVFANSSDIVIGGINSTNQILYNSSMPGLDSVTTLLNTSNAYLQEMSNTLQELTNLFTQASTQNFSQSALATLDAQFQIELNNLNQIATNASVGPFTPLDGSISAATPLNINTPTGDVIPITIPDMTNAASPIGSPQPGDLQVEFSSTLLAFQAAIPVDGGGNRVNVLSSIKTFCGQNSFLYIVANQINIGLGAPADAANCIAYLSSVQWNTLLLSSTDIAVAQTLTDVHSGFMLNPGGTIATDVGLGGPIDEILYAIINDALTPIAAAPPFIPNQYIVQASNMLSISSPTYFPVVAERLQSARMYLASTQSSINQQIQVVNGLKARYEAASDMYGEAADKYLKTDILEATLNLRQLMSSQSFVIDATTGFHTKLNKTIADTVMQILRKH